jgi:hypothetical protein
MDSDSIVLRYSDLAQGGTSHKEYRIHIVRQGNGYVVNYENGRIDGPMIGHGTKTPTPVSYESARIIAERLQAEKERDPGYTVVDVPVLPSLNPKPAPKPISVPPQGALPPCELLVEIKTEAEAERLLSDNRYYMQQKRDGRFLRVIKRDGEIFGLNKKNDRTAVPAKFLADLKRLDLESFDIAGENEGDFFPVWDALDLGGPLTKIPNISRFEKLLLALGSIEPRHAVYPVPTWFATSTKTPAFRQLKKDRAEGVAFKRADALYHAGEGPHRKFKWTATASCIVTAIHVKKVGTKPGCYKPDPGKSNAAVALLNGSGKLVPVGEVSTIGRDDIKVGDIVEIRYLYATEASQLTQPRMIECGGAYVRTDVKRERCTLSQLKYKQDVEVAA